MAIEPLPDGKPPRRRMFARRSPEPPKNAPRSLHGSSLRVVTAAGQRLKMDDKTEARRIRKYRSGWQQDAIAYRSSVPAIRYAMEYIGNNASRMLLYIGMPNPEDPTGQPVRLSELGDAIPPEIIDVCAQAMESLGSGRMAYASLMKQLAINFETPGECFLVGREDTRDETEWKIRSINELLVTDDGYKIRDSPITTGTSDDGWEDLNPLTTYVSRLWVPDPFWSALADSPMRAILDSAEEWMILSRQIRAAGRSRLAGAGILRVPDGLTTQSWNEDNTDPQSDSFIADVVEAMMTPIADEGTASAVVPLIIRGDIEALNGLSHLLIERPSDMVAAQQRNEALTNIGIGLNLPREVITGLGDLSHWNAFQVDDNTFRMHTEPGVIQDCDALTTGFLRPYLETAGVAEWWWRRLCVWYDPTELVTHPDRTQDAITLYNLREISGAALRKATGFSEEDAPSNIEVVTRLVSNTRTFPANVLLALVARLDPTITVPAITTSGTIPGIKAGQGAYVPPPVEAAPVAGPALPPPTGETQGPPPEPGPTGGPPATNPQGGAPAGGPPDTSSGPPAMAAEPVSFAAKVPAKALAASRKLSDVDRILRTRLHAAACSSMLRALERAGARVRTQIRNGRGDALGDAAAAKVAAAKAETNPALVAATLGEPLVASLGLSGPELVGSDWSDLRAAYMSWTGAAQAQALRTALSIAGLPAESELATTAIADQAVSLEKSWEVMSRALTALAEKLIYAPGGTADPATMLTIDPTTIVPTGTIRAALAVAGGYDKPGLLSDVAADPGGIVLMNMGVPVGQIGTGETISNLLTDGGAESAYYIWEHGNALKPFEGHERLDGVEFQNFDDDVLAVERWSDYDGWPDEDSFMVGDHQGCQCDFTQVWQPGTGSGSGSGEGD